MNKEQIWNIVLVISLILIFHGMMNGGSDDKKTAEAGGAETGLGTAGAIVSFAAKKQLIWYAVPLIVGAFLLLGPNIVTNWINLFNPQAGIPMWVWGIAIVIIFMMVTNKK